MPEMPAPTTSTLTGSVGVTGGELYRRVSLSARNAPSGRGPRGDHGSEAVCAPGSSRDGDAGPGTQGALLRSGLLPDGGRAAVASGLADGVPARGDPGAPRLRRVHVPRP